MGFNDGSFGFVKSESYWWASTESGIDFANIRRMSGSSDNIGSATGNWNSKSDLLYVRCVKD